MYLLIIYLLTLLHFTVTLVSIYQVRKHPFTSLAFTGASSESLVIFLVLFAITQGDFYTIGMLMGLFLTVSCRLLMKKGKDKSLPVKSLLMQGMIAGFLLLLTVFLFTIVYLPALCVMSILATSLVPKNMKNERKQLLK